MKRASSIIIICLILFGLISCQKKINSGLVAYYPFNGDARDYSGNDNHGVVDGPVLTTDRFGNYPSGDQYFAGALDDIRIYNRNLNQDEITVLFNEGK